MLERYLRAHPDDETAWLVYADALLERGDVRGTLIQLEQKLRDPALPEALRARLSEQQTQIEREHEQQWLDGWVCPEGGTLGWRAGFVCEVWLPASALPDLASLLQRPVAAPLCEIRLESFQAGQLPELLEMLPSGLRGLALAPDPFDISRGRSPRREPLGPEHAEALARCPALSSLCLLALPHQRLGDEGLSRLARSQLARSLTSLVLCDNGLQQGACPELASFPGLRVLLASDNRLGDAVLEAICSMSLFDLDLSDCTLGPRAAERLAESEAMGGLHWLTLRDNCLSDAGACALASSPWLGELEELSLAGNALGPEGAEALVQSQALRSLRLLWIDEELIHEDLFRAAPFQVCSAY